MGDYILYIVTAVMIVIYIVYKVATAKSRRFMKTLSKVRAAYGSIPTKEYSDEELNKIRQYFEAVKSDKRFSIDDITWNDLDMDTIFITMNQTFSSPGEDVLYDILREPSMSQDELDEKNRVIDFFMHNQPMREAFEMDFASIGKTKRVSLLSYLGDFRKLTLKPSSYYYFHLIIMLVGIIVTIISPVVGILILIAAAIYNVYTYYRDKSVLEAYYVSLASIARLVRGAEMVSRHDCAPLKVYLDILKDNLKPVLSIKKDMKWLGNAGAVGTSSDMMQLLLDYVRILTHFDFIKFNKMAKIVNNNETAILRLYRTMGYLEAMIAVASFRETLPFYCYGQFKEGKGTGIRIKEGYHPLITEPVANSIDEEGPVLLTGSNASGKSTFLKTAALCSILAQTVCTVPAHEFESRFYRTYTSMALKDNLQQSESYFIVEIKSLKRILDASQEGENVLCFVDEVLRGTNTVERIAASSQILKKLQEAGVMSFAATHDIELTYMLEKHYANYHFEEEVTEDNVLFNFILKEGRAVSRNAIKLLNVIGYDAEVVSSAEKQAADFMESGVWKLL